MIGVSPGSSPSNSIASTETSPAGSKVSVFKSTSINTIDQQRLAKIKAKANFKEALARFHSERDQAQTPDKVTVEFNVIDQENRARSHSAPIETSAPESNHSGTSPAGAKVSVFKSTSIKTIAQQRLAKIKAEASFKKALARFRSEQDQAQTPGKVTVGFNVIDQENRARSHSAPIKTSAPESNHSRSSSAQDRYEKKLKKIEELHNSTFKIGSPPIPFNQLGLLERASIVRELSPAVGINPNFNFDSDSNE